MERLTKHDGNYCDTCGGEKGDFCACAEEIAMYDRLSAYEDILYAPDGTERISLDRLKELVEAEKDGRCVVLPCKVGDTVWFVGETYDRTKHEFEADVQDGYVKAIKFSARPAKITVEYPDIAETNGRCKGCDYFIANIGKTVFFTCQEAEAALEKGEK